MAVTEEIIPIKSNEGDHAHTAAPRRGASGMVRLLGLSGIAMALGFTNRCLSAHHAIARAGRPARSNN